MSPIEFYFDFASPYGFLAAMQMERIGRRDADALLRAIQNDSVKQRLIREHERGISKGVFGSPFFFFVDGEPFWGSDRIAFLAQA